MRDLKVEVKTLFRLFRQIQDPQTAIRNILIDIFCDEEKYKGTVMIQSCQIDKNEMSFTGTNPFIVSFRIEILVSDESKDVDIIPIVQDINSNIPSNNDANFEFEKADDNNIGEQSFFQVFSIQTHTIFLKKV